MQLPVTTDKAAVQQMLDEIRLRMAGPKTMLGDAIGLAITLFERSEVPERMMLLLTDGNDTGSQVPPVRAAEIARDRGVVIHTIGIGDPSRAGEEALDETVLKSVPSTTGGGYFHAADATRARDAQDPRPSGAAPRCADRADCLCGECAPGDAIHHRRPTHRGVRRGTVAPSHAQGW